MLTSTRNLKENFDLTNNWLNEIDQVLNIKSNEDQEVYDRIKSELISRKEALVKNLVANESSKKIVDQLINRIDSVNKKLDFKSNRIKNLQNLLENFNTNYEKLNLYSKRLANKLECLDISSGQLMDSRTQQIKSNKTPSLESVQESIKLVEDLKSDIEENEENCLNKILKPLLKQIETQFAGEINLEKLETNLEELKIDLNKLILSCVQKLKELEELKQELENYSNLKQKIDIWLNTMEANICNFEPIGMEIEFVEKQYEQLDNLLKDYENKSLDLKEFNKFKIKAETDFVKVNESYQWIGQRLEERKRELGYCLDQMKDYLQELNNLNLKLQKFEANLNKNLDLKLSIQKSEVLSLNNEFKKLEPELNQFNLDMESVKLKGKHFVYNSNELKDLNQKYSFLNSSYSECKQKIDQYLNNLNQFESIYSNLKHSLEQKEQMLSIMSLGVNSDVHLIETVIKQIELLRNDLTKKDYSLLEELNKHGEYLLEFAREGKEDLNEKLKNLNSTYDLLSNQFNSTLEFKYKLRDLSAQFAAKRQNFYDQLSGIDNRLNDFSKQVNKNAQKVLEELDRIENEQLNECNELYEGAQECVAEIVDLARGYFLLNGFTDLSLSSDDEISLKIGQMKTSIDNTFSTLCSLRNLFEQSLAKEKSFAQLYTNLCDFIQLKSQELTQQQGLYFIRSIKT